MPLTFIKKTLFPLKTTATSSQTGVKMKQEERNSGCTSSCIWTHGSRAETESIWTPPDHRLVYKRKSHEKKNHDHLSCKRKFFFLWEERRVKEILKGKHYFTMFCPNREEEWGSKNVNQREEDQLSGGGKWFCLWILMWVIHSLLHHLNGSLFPELTSKFTWVSRKKLFFFGITMKMTRGQHLLFPSHKKFHSFETINSWHRRIFTRLQVFFAWRSRQIVA